ncbi:MAG: winged helix-turn-helix domain-containing protein [Hyphomonadaceae bacterium]
MEHVHEVGAIASRAAHPAVRALAVDADLLDRHWVSALSEWRRAGVLAPVIFLLASGMAIDPSDGVGLDLCGFLFKPWRAEDLLTGINGLLLRQRQTGVGLLQHGDLSLNTLSKEVILAGQPLELTAFEYRMLRYFMMRQRHVLSQAELMEHIYTSEESRGSNTIEVYVSRLRRRIGPWRIRTVRGLGYRFG